MPRCLILVLLLLVSSLMAGCGGNDASAQSGKTVTGTANLDFHLPDSNAIIRCPVGLTQSGKVPVSIMGKAGSDQFRLSGSVQVMERNTVMARIFVRMMLYKNARPDGSFDFNVEVKPGVTKSLNLGQGMMLDASL
jgi:hypothetical protein